MSHHPLQRHSCPAFPPEAKSCSSWDEAGELLHKILSPSVHPWIRLHLFPPKYHRGQYLPVMVNPRSHLSPAHGKLCWTRPKKLHEQNIKWVKAGAQPSFPHEHQQVGVTARSNNPRVASLLPGQTRPRTAQTRVISTPRDRASVLIGKASLRTGGVWIRQACRGVTGWGIKGNVCRADPKDSRLLH